MMQSEGMQAVPLRMWAGRGAGVCRGRRTLFRGSGILFGTLAAGCPLALLAPSRSWALALRALNEEQGRTLLSFARTLYPHERLPDAVYALPVKTLDEQAAADVELKRMLVDGLRRLDGGRSGSFVQAERAEQLRRVRALQGDGFFERVRSTCITTLYDNEMCFAAFGYPGASWQQGGYLTRGFQDLTWLPDPPAVASPQWLENKGAGEGQPGQGTGATARAQRAGPASPPGANRPAHTEKGGGDGTL